MRLTDRDISVLLKVNECQWLSTSQSKRYFFAATTNRAINKRLKLLVDEKYLFCDRTSSTEDYFFRLGLKAKPLLEERGLDAESISILRRFPAQLNHFAAINDLRWHAEQAIQRRNGKLDFFVADRELKGTMNNSLVIPDALLGFRLVQQGVMQQNTVALEYDADTENPQYFGRDKVRKYVLALERGVAMFLMPNLRVAVFADSRKRIVSLVRHSIKFIDGRLKFLFGSMEDLELNTDLFAPMFIDPKSNIGSKETWLVSFIE